MIQYGDRIVMNDDSIILPEKFRAVKALSGSVTPDWLMYLFDTDFDFSDWNRFFPRDEIDKYHKIYQTMLE